MQCKTIVEIPNKNYEVCVSCSLFKMQYAYRGFEKYTKNLDGLSKFIPKQYYIRLYVDASVMEDSHFLEFLDKEYDNVEIVMFEDRDFLVDSKNLTDSPYFHDGTFGTMARFLALYNYPPLFDSVKYIWLSDVDVPKYTFDYKNILDMKKYNVNLSLYSKACYNRDWIPKDVKLYPYPIMASKFITSVNVKYSYKDFNTFLENVLNDKYHKLREILALKGRQVMKVKYFYYGLDELFMVEYLYKVFNKNPRLINYDISLDGLIKKYKNKYFLEKIDKLVNYIWKQDVKNDSIVRNLKNFKKEYDKFYNEFKDKKLDGRYTHCLKEYAKYRNSIDTEYEKHWGLVNQLLLY